MVGRRNFFAHGELPLVLLALIARAPVHGYDLMNELGRLLEPDYEPSPGSVYPALAALVSEGLVATDPATGRRRRYRATRRGRDALAHKRAALRAFEVRTGVRLAATDVAGAIERFSARLAPIAERLDPDSVEDVLAAAAEELEALVFAKEDSRNGR